MSKVATTLLGLGIALMPYPLPVLGLRSGTGVDSTLVLFLADLPLLALSVLMVGPGISDARRRQLTPGVVIWGLILVSFAVSWVIQPSLSGVQVLLRGAITFGIAIAIARARPNAARFAVSVTIASAALQGTFAMAQFASGRPLGLDALGERAIPLVIRSGAVVTRGTMVHEYVLVAFALLAVSLIVVGAYGARRTLPLVAAVFAAFPIGTTYMRTAAVAFALGMLALVPDVIRAPRRFAPLAGAILAGAMIPALLGLSGWLERADSSLNERPADVSTDRRVLAAMALELIAERPLFGVGTGLYERAVEDRKAAGIPTLSASWRPHDVPLLLAAEAGLHAGVLALTLLLVLGLRAWRCGPPARFLFATFALFFLLEDQFISISQGVVMAGIWIGVLDRLSAGRELRLADEYGAPGPQGERLDAEG